ncbi:hypothetical protein ACFQ88_10955 [Paenibacillus sp. NPDC056579]|uniref:hypothetical protein n=1 Tax=Paenibacillus sp. NPDC056579 TaxID=3345871 RepID=UPI003682BB38
MGLLDIVKIIIGLTLAFIFIYLFGNFNLSKKVVKAKIIDKKKKELRKFVYSEKITVYIYTTNEIIELNTADYFTKTEYEEILIGSSGNLTYRGALLIKFTIDPKHKV